MKSHVDEMVSHDADQDDAGDGAVAQQSATT